MENLNQKIDPIKIPEEAKKRVRTFVHKAIRTMLHMEAIIFLDKNINKEFSSKYISNILEAKHKRIKNIIDDFVREGLARKEKKGFFEVLIIYKPEYQDMMLVKLLVKLWEDPPSHPMIFKWILDEEQSDGKTFH